jgi:cell wall-associated NlpC family hydrolase
MLSITSVISVNLLAAVATPGTDSVRAARSVSSVVTAAIVEESPANDRAMHVEAQLLKTAKRYLGTRYRLGGVMPSAFDCSGFVRYVFAKQGIELPRTAREQAQSGQSIVVGPDSLRVGDLLFFRTPRGRAGHVAIYVGDGRIIHASSGSRRVRYDDLASPRGKWFISRLTGVRRVLLLTSDRREATLLLEVDKRRPSPTVLANAATVQ